MNDMSSRALLAKIVGYQINSDPRGHALLSEFDPSSVEDSILLGEFAVLCFQMNFFPKAIEIFYRLVDLNPSDEKAHNNLGVSLEKIGEIARAALCYERALDLNPTYASAAFNRATLFLNAGQLDEAIDLYNRILVKSADHLPALTNLAIGLMRKDNFQSAIEKLSVAIALHPGDFDARLNLGYALYRLGRYDAALEHYNRLINIGKKSPPLYNNIGLLQQSVGNFSDAEKAFTTAIAMDASFVEAKHNLGHLNLLQMNFAEGWKGYHYRPTRRHSTLPLPPRDILHSVPTEPITIIHEQGIGDELFFLRFLPLLSFHKKDISYVPSAKSHGLLLKGADIALTDAPSADGKKTYLVGDLPWLCGHDNIRACPDPLPLQPDKRLLEYYSNRLSSLPRPWVGITWRAGESGINTLDKRFPMEQLLSLVDSVGGSVFALQRGISDTELTLLAANNRYFFFDSQLHDDLTHMLAVVSLLDDYIGVSNTITHIRAGVRGPMRVLIPHPPEWRWGHDITASPWFPTATIYRQTRTADWNPAVRQIFSDLAYSVQNN